MTTNDRFSVGKRASSSILDHIYVNWRTVTLAVILLIAVLTVHVLSSEVFLSGRNIAFLLRQSATVGVVACGVAVIIVMGEIDLSIGSAVYLVGVASATAQSVWGLDIYTSLAFGVAVGITLGIWQGFWVAYVGIPSFIVTLSGLLSFRGLGLYWSEARTISPLSPVQAALTNGYLPIGETAAALFVTVAIAGAFILLTAHEVGKSDERRSIQQAWLRVTIMVVATIAYLASVYAYRGTPLAILWTVLVACIITFVMTSTVFGRNLYMIGANRVAARMAGIAVRRTAFLAFVLMGSIYGIAGILFTSRLNASTPNDGMFLELDAIAAAVIGGVALSGGRGRIPMVFLGAVALTAIDNAMSVMGASSFLQQIIKGMILLCAVALDVKLRSDRIQ